MVFILTHNEAYLEIPKNAMKSMLMVKINWCFLYMGKKAKKIKPKPKQTRRGQLL